MGELRARIDAVAAGAGLAGLGVASVEPFTETEAALRERRRTGMSARLGFTFRDPARATDIRRSFPWAERLVVASYPYLPAAGSPGPGRPGQGRIARFAVGDFYVPLRRALAAVADVLREAGHRAEVLVDDSRLVDRAAAVRAGVGWWGKNTMVLAPGEGPWLLLGSVVTDALLEPDEPMRRDCGRCEACLPACPTGALVAPGILDARRCLAYWLQAPGAIPRDLREPMGDRFYGCDDCLEACPPGRRSVVTAGEGRGRVDLGWVLAATDAELLETFARFYIPRHDPNILRRNALVAVGNVGGRELVPVVIGYLDHPDPNLRSHAVWALGRLDPAALEVHAERLAADPAPEVEEELRAWRSGHPVATPEGFSSPPTPTGS